MRKVYLDYAATTPADPEVVQAMLPYFTYVFANPLSVHDFGRSAATAVDVARDTVARFLGAKPDEIVFTSGGTESNNTAIKGAAFAARSRGNHIITTTIEHRAILSPCVFLERQGFSVTRLPVDGNGMVDPDAVRRVITPQTILISVMHANNEIGTILPIADIGIIARERGVLFHTDAVQTFGHIPVNVDDLRVDLLSASAHKFYGPKGVGFLYIRKGAKIGRFMHGGSQEKNRRASTHNVPGIVGLAKAVEIAGRGEASEMRHLTRLRTKVIDGVLGKIKRAQLNGHPTQRLPGNVNLSFRNVQGERLLRGLNAAGIGCSTGSACGASNAGPSHVLDAIGLSFDMIAGSLRLSLGKQVSEEDIDYVIDILPREVRMLRAVEQA
ncbi:MAG TPA: IscS subfamily cysteine desulfurase [Dissulfurispiraceae bacterium]|nr:IscS subfamily cysteine desulfurase [Dissulfurispiraceae bacterium]